MRGTAGTALQEISQWKQSSQYSINPLLAQFLTPYPLVICYIAIENGPVEIVDLLSYKMVDLSSSLCGCLPEGISTNIPVFGLIEPLESPLNTIKPY